MKRNRFRLIRNAVNGNKFVMCPKYRHSLRSKKRKRKPRLRPKSQRPKASGNQKGDGVLFPSTRVPKGMDKKTAKKLKKATRHKF